MGRKKSLRLQYDPPERCQVRFGLHTPVGTRGVGFVCVFGQWGGEGWVATCFSRILKKQIHKAWATQTPCRAYARVHTCQCAHAHVICAYVPPACTQTRTSPSPACSPPTLFLSHYLTPIKYDWITQESFHQLVYTQTLVFAEGALFLLHSYSVSLLLGFHTSAMPPGFLIFFFSPFSFLLGCFTKLNTVYFGKG